MPISIEDVARLANVSISTVSRVVNRSHLVNAETRRRVEEAIRQLGYRPNAFARGLMLRRSEILGLVLPDLHGEFYSEIIRGATRQAREAGYHLVVSTAADNVDGRSLLQSIEQHALLDGVALMVTDIRDRAAEELAELRIPCVLLDADVSDTPHDSVIVDQRTGAAQLLRHLIETCQAQRIWFVGGPQTNIDTIIRLSAFEDALAASALARSDDDVCFLDYSFDAAYEWGRERARHWAGERHFVFAANDNMAAGLLAAAAACGVPVPQRLGIVGFDDMPIARMSRPLLTTVRAPMDETGARAIELLCRRLAEPARPFESIVLRPELVVRESCGAALRLRGAARRKSS